jgi:apolipoprotein N-acyltransferase
MHAASTGWPVDLGWSRGQILWPLHVASMAVLAACLLRTRCAGQAFRAAWVFGTSFLACTFWWLFVAMHTYGGLAAPLAVVAVLLLAGALATYFGLACGLWWRLAQQRPGIAPLLFGALWMMAEMARGTWLTGFGWGAGGYAHLDGPLAFYAPWIGVYGITALAAGMAMAMAQSVLTKLHVAIALPRGFSLRHRRMWSGAVLTVLLPLLVPAGANQWTQSSGNLSVTLLQGNIPQNEKFEVGTGVMRALHWYQSEMLAARTALVVAPETAIPLLPRELPEGYLKALRDHFSAAGHSAIVGIPLGDDLEGYTNSVVALTGDGANVLRYDKHHLVPFGEFIPPLFRWFTALMHIPLGDFNRGALGQPSFEVQGQRLAPNICYEDLFGEELATRFTDAAIAPTVFVNVSNLGWFGDTVAVDQHLTISRMRALEFQRPFVRATNSGATAILDHQGHITAALPRMTAGALVGEVQGREGMTPFAWWASRFGLWPLWLLGLALVLPRKIKG